MKTMSYSESRARYAETLDSVIDEKTLYDTFGQFGPLTVAPKIARDEHGLSKGYGFISFGDFDSSDAAIASMHGQYMMSKQISVQYAYKKDGKGERHGDEAERMLALAAAGRDSFLMIIPEKVQADPNISTE